jgi:type II secretory pathway component PulF
MRQQVRAGSPLEEAMAREPRVFSTIFLSMIRLAETRGGSPRRCG